MCHNKLYIIFAYVLFLIGSNNIVELRAHPRTTSSFTALKPDNSFMVTITLRDLPHTTCSPSAGTAPLLPTHLDNGVVPGGKPFVTKKDRYGKLRCDRNSCSSPQSYQIGTWQTTIDCHYDRGSFRPTFDSFRRIATSWVSRWCAQ
jgi:hypothetical protein